MWGNRVQMIKNKLIILKLIPRRELTSIKQVGILISKLFAGDKVLFVSVERQEWCHVVVPIVPNGCIKLWILGWRWAVPP